MVKFIIGVLVLIMLFLPSVFHWLVSAFGFIMDLLYKIFVYPFTQINFETMNAGVSGILASIGGFLAPAMNLLPDSPLVPAGITLLLIILFILLCLNIKDMSDSGFDAALKLMYAWCFAAFNLGMIIAGSGHEFQYMSMFESSFLAASPINLFNYAQWTFFGKLMLWLTLLGGGLVSILFAFTSGIRAFFRTWVGLGLFTMFGYIVMHLRLWLPAFLSEHLGFIGGILSAPLYLVEALLIIQFFFGIIVFFLSSDTIAELNRMRKERQYEKAQSAFDDDFSFEPDKKVPVYVTDEDGNNYPVSLDGDFLYINLPSGNRISKKWEDIEGYPYFLIDGKRFYLH